MTNLNSKVKQQLLIEIGKKIKQVRKDNGLTQIELAFRINADDKKISRIERGEHNFGITSLFILAEALKVPVPELLNIKNVNYFQAHIWE